MAMKLFPLFTDSLPPELQLVPAILIGFGFGFVLEKAGFGSARILAAQFYFYNMRVFKVMFSAIITAAAGLALAAALGLVDWPALQIPETFLWPHLVGGLLLGAGFIISGYCPGTSIVAAASGKWDGLLAVAGVVLGSVLFGELYPRIEGFYLSGAQGIYTLPDLLGAGYPVLVAAISLAAAGMFFGAQKVEAIFAARTPLHAAAAHGDAEAPSGGVVGSLSGAAGGAAASPGARLAEGNPEVGGAPSRPVPPAPLHAAAALGDAEAPSGGVVGSLSRAAGDLNMLAVTGDHECKVQSAECKVQDGHASRLPATIPSTTLRAGDHPPSHEASAGLRRPSTITHDCLSARSCLASLVPLALVLVVALVSAGVHVAGPAAGEAAGPASVAAEWNPVQAARALVEEPGRLVVVDLRERPACAEGADRLPAASCLSDVANDLAAMPATRTLLVYGADSVSPGELGPELGRFPGRIVLLAGGSRAWSSLILGRGEVSALAGGLSEEERRLLPALRAYFTGAKVQASAPAATVPKVRRAVKKSGGCS
jgi:hypothetical protein